MCSLAHTSRRDFVLASSALTLSRLVGAQTRGELTFGMVPYLPVQQLIRLYEPVVSVIEGVFSAPCRLVSATDFAQFLERGRGGEFDAIGASPHVARLLNREVGYLPLVRATAPLQPVLVVAAESSMKQLMDVRNKSILVADPLAVHVLIPMRGLRDVGMVPGRDVQVVVAGNQRNAIQRMLNGEAPAAVASMSTLGTLPKDMAARVRVLHAFPAGLTPMAYLVHPRHIATASRLTQALLAFSNSAGGREHVKLAQHEGLVQLGLKELEGQDAIVTEYFRMRQLP